MEISAPLIDLPSEPFCRPQESPYEHSYEFPQFQGGTDHPRRITPKWSTEQKQAITARSFEPGMSATEVVRAYGISSGVMPTWRWALLAAQPSPVGADAQFARVQIVRRSRQGAIHWSTFATLIQTAKLNDVEPLAWLADVLKRMVSGQTKRHELDQLLPWN